MKTEQEGPFLSLAQAMERAQYLEHSGEAYNYKFVPRNIHGKWYLRAVKVYFG